MLFKVIRLLIIGALLIGLATFVRTEIMHYWNNKIVKEARDFKLPIKITPTIKPTVTTNATTNPPTGPCADNTISQEILVSISQRELWACSYTQNLYNSSVITGMENLAADLTPTGTYHIYSKQQDTHLIGHDSTGSWDDHVSYWMPFLSNQYGVYGFHDATWRDDSAFGNISPYSTNASHGCVECPLVTAAWLYNWAVIGTTVTIES